jgi:hypothetical protein
MRLKEGCTVTLESRCPPTLFACPVKTSQPFAELWVCVCLKNSNNNHNFKLKIIVKTKLKRIVFFQREIKVHS